MAIPKKPITRQEQYWAAILDKIQGGGDVQPYGETATYNITRTAVSLSQDDYELFVNAEHALVVADVTITSGGHMVLPLVASTPDSSALTLKFADKTVYAATDNHHSPQINRDTRRFAVTTTRYNGAVISNGYSVKYMFYSLANFFPKEG